MAIKLKRQPRKSGDCAGKVREFFTSELAGVVWLEAATASMFGWLKTQREHTKAQGGYG